MTFRRRLGLLLNLFCTINLPPVPRTYIFNGRVKVRIQENGQSITLTRTTDFEKHFPGVDLHHAR